MSNENKPETTATSDAGTASDVGNNAPAINAAGVDDQSSSANDAGEPTTTDAQSEPTGDVEQAASAPAPAPAPIAAPEVKAVATPVAPPAPVKAVAPVVQELPSNSIAGVTPHENVNRLLADVPKSKHGIIHFLVEYARDMAPRRPIPVNEGAGYQVNLYRQLHALINQEDEHFRPLFTAVLRMFENEADGCFRASHAFRFMESVTLNRDERESFMSLVDALRLLGPVQGRKDAATQVSLAKVLAKNMTDTGRARVLSYFDGTI